MGKQLLLTISYGYMQSEKALAHGEGCLLHGQVSRASSVYPLDRGMATGQRNGHKHAIIPAPCKDFLLSFYRKGPEAQSDTVGTPWVVPSQVLLASRVLVTPEILGTDSCFA